MGLMSFVSWLYFQCLTMRSNTLNFKSTPQQNVLVLFSLWFSSMASSVLQTKAKEDSRESFKGQGTKCVKGRLPYDTSSILTIPRGKQREFLAKKGMSGKICAHRDMSPSEVEEEIGSVFRGTFRLFDSDQFQFDYLTPSLRRPFKPAILFWTADRRTSEHAFRFFLEFCFNTPLVAVTNVG